jgi:hypothetical protein
MEIEMKTLIAALALLSLAAGPVFAASPTAWQLQEGRASAFVPFSGGHSMAPDYSATSREGLIRAN